MNASQILASGSNMEYLAFFPIALSLKIGHSAEFTSKQIQCHWYVQLSCYQKVSVFRTEDIKDTPILNISEKSKLIHMQVTTH